MTKNINCIILAAGKGTRMQSKDTHKVCFEINGRAAILHAIDRYKRAGLGSFNIVVGTMAEQVMQTVSSEYSGVNFAYQRETLGTGNAARVGFESLSPCAADNPVFITMGDKIIDPRVIRDLIHKFTTEDLDLAFVVAPRAFNASGGHIVYSDGKVKGIVESLDIQMARFCAKVLQQLESGSYTDRDPRQDIDKISADIITSERKRKKVLDSLETVVSHIRDGNTPAAIEILTERSRIKLGDTYFDPDTLDAAEHVNTAIYLFKPSAFRAGLAGMTTDNAGKEEYLTEVVNTICNSDDYKASAMVVNDRADILTYNNVIELLKVEEILSGATGEQTLSLSHCKPVQDWISLFTTLPQSVYDVLKDIYGDHPEIISERQAAYIEVLRHFASKFGTDKNVVISRAPGRVNLMGRHVEHRGGNVNVISIDKELLCVAAANPDAVNITNTDPTYKDRTFSIEDHFKNVNWDSWLSYLESDEISSLIHEFQGDWLNYVKAPLIRLQYLFKDRRLSGMDIAYSGNIPVAAGLSSSSAIVVATAEASVVLNNLDVTPQKFVDLCGEGEWFVGTRGGSGDHAAMKFGQRGYIASLGFFPFGYRGAVEFPKGYKLLIANSYIKANKTTNAKDLFNQRVASYEFGLMMIKDKYPLYKDKLKHLRDVNPDTLGVPPSVIYSMLLELPERIAPEELFDSISTEHHEHITRIIKSHNPPEYYELRSVVLYGIAECQRSFNCGKLLQDSDFVGFGKMMNISHDGDRVAIMASDAGEMTDYDYTAPDDYIHALIADLQSEDVSRVAFAQLDNQPGGYACSTSEIDFIVDTVNKIDGVVGAQLSGAGLGGCVMILAKDEAVDTVTDTLLTEYYQPNNLDNGITVCVPVKGSGIISVE